MNNDTENLVAEIISTPSINLKKLINDYKDFKSLISLVFFIVPVASYYFILKNWDSKISDFFCIMCFLSVIVGLWGLILPIIRWIVIPITLFCFSLIIAIIMFIQIVLVSIAKVIVEKPFF